MSLTQQAAFSFFVSRGWTPAQAAGIVANLQEESGLRPDAVGDGGAAYGIAQWHPDRQAHFAGLFGKPIQGSTFEEQLHFVHAELQGSEKRAGDLLATCSSAGMAADTVCRYYERPADPDGDSAKRAPLAEAIFRDYGGATPAGPVLPAPQPSPPNAPGGHMPALLLPLLSSIIGKFLNPGVAQNAMSIITKDGGQSTAAQNLINTLLGAVAGVAGVTPAAIQADDSVAIKAVAAVQSNPEKLKAVEEAAAAHLNAVMPFVQQLAALDQMRYEAEIRGKQAVSSIAIEEHKAGLWDMTKWIVISLLCMLWGIAWGLLGAILWLATSGSADKNPAMLTALVGLAGPIWAGAIVASVAAIVAYRFDGSKESQAAAEAVRATTRYREETGKS